MAEVRATQVAVAVDSSEPHGCVHAFLEQGFRVANVQMAPVDLRIESLDRLSVITFIYDRLLQWPLCCNLLLFYLLPAWHSNSCFIVTSLRECF
jgi:hypothetical protein